MRVGSLFTGIGGFDLAAESVGYEIAWQSEIDKYANEVLAQHWPEVANLGDIHDIKTPAAVDLLCGGFPCQDYSVAGNRRGLAGDRGALWWQFHRLIGELMPRWVVGENVPGLLSSRGGEDFATIINSLVELGYGVVWRVLDAQWFGLAQRRRRLFVVGHLGDRPRPEILALAQSVSGDTQPSREKGENPAPTLAARTRGGGFPGSDEAMDGAVIPFAQNQRNEVRDLGDVAGALAAEPGMKQQTYIFNHSVRKLTPLECERLQGFPDHWTAINSDTQRYRELGNAVAVPVARWIFEQITRVGSRIT